MRQKAQILTFAVLFTCRAANDLPDVLYIFDHVMISATDTDVTYAVMLLSHAFYEDSHFSVTSTSSQTVHIFSSWVTKISLNLRHS